MKTSVQLAIVGAGALVLLYLAKRTADGVGQGYSTVWNAVGAGATQAWNGASNAAWAVTPWNQDNVIYGGVNNMGAYVTGDTSFNLGGYIYDLTHPDPLAQAPAPAPAPKPSGTRYDNPIYQGGNYIGTSIFNDPDWTIGGWLYDITH